MELTFCSKTAFRYYRIPAQILGLYPAVNTSSIDRRCCNLRSHPFVEDLLHTPLHRFAFCRAQFGSRSLFKSHLLTQEPPPGSFRQTEHGFDITSPEFTLLNLATQASRNQLLMACYEMCSSFAVFEPCERAQQQLDEAISLQLIPPNCGWERVKDTKGNDTNLWKRTPLTSAADIAAFAKQAAGLRGVKQLRWAAERMTGQTASPFEVQTSMLISLPRDEGGLGIDIANNARIPLSEAARSLYDKTCCYTDILIESATDSMGVILECQGRSAHDSEAASLSDAERTTALSSMGYDASKLPTSRSRTRRALTTSPSSFIKRPGFPTPQRPIRNAPPKMPCGGSYWLIGMDCSPSRQPASSWRSEGLRGRQKQ